jgi:hypothetical protein
MFHNFTEAVKEFLCKLDPWYDFDFEDNESQKSCNFIMRSQTFVDRMKELELEYKNVYLEFDKCTIINSRVNGLTKFIHNKELFGNKYYESMMEEISKQIILTFTPNTVYFHENEFVMLFKSFQHESEATPFGANLPLIYSRFSSFITLKVYEYMTKFITENLSIKNDKNDKNDKLIIHMKEFLEFCEKNIKFIYVDTNILQVAESDVVNYMVFKSNYTKHNAIRCLYKKSVKDPNMNLEINSLIKALETENVLFEEKLSNYELYGSYFKLEKYELSIPESKINKVKNNKNSYQRVRPIQLLLNMYEYDEDINNILNDKYYIIQEEL